MKKNYLKNLRQKIGHQKVIHPAARIIIENDEEEFLFIKRKDNLNWGIPAGALEEDETIEECIKREVMEEVGLTINSVIVTGISSNPKLETVEYPNQDVVQYFSINFYSNDWSGNIRPDLEETLEVIFFGKNELPNLPNNELSAFESLEFYKKNKTIKLS